MLLMLGITLAKVGAFFAGMMMRESEFSHRAAEESLQLRDAFSVLFFFSVGKRFDPRMLLDEPLCVLAVVAIIMAGKTIAAVLPVVAFPHPLNSVLTLCASLAQIGEPAVLVPAHIAKAAMLVIATPDTLGVRGMVEVAKTLNPGIEVVVRSHNEEEAGLLEAEQVGKVFMGEHELARGMAGHVLARMVRGAAAGS